MHDKYDSPDGGEEELYEETPMDKAKEIGGNAAEIIRQNRKPIAAAIVAIIALFFIYDFFIGSVMHVSFDVTDTEGNSINASIKINSLSGNEVARAVSGETISLKKGDYTIDVAASDFRPILKQGVSVSDDNGISVNMQADLGLELAGTFPESFFTGEEKSVMLTITSNESDAVETQLVLDGDAKSAMSIQYDTPLYVSKGQNQITAKITANTNVDKKQLGENKEGEIRIRGLDTANATVKGKYALKEFNAKDVAAKFGSSDTKADFGNLSPGENKEQPITVENKGNSELTSFRIEAEITDPDFLSAEEIQNWFMYTPSNEIPSIAPKTTERASVTLKIPTNITFPQGKESAKIDGVIRVKTSYYKKEFNINLNIEKPKTGVSTSGLKSSYTIGKSDGAYRAETGFLAIRNSGETLLKNFDIRAQCFMSAQQVYWLMLNNQQGEYTFDSLEKGATKSVPFTIQVPNSTPENQRAQCDLRIGYSEPNGQFDNADSTIVILTSA